MSCAVIPNRRIGKLDSPMKKEIKMSDVWNQRAVEILSDPKKAKVAALLYYLIETTMQLQITRKRRCPEELLWEEAHMHAE